MKSKETKSSDVELFARMSVEQMKATEAFTVVASNGVKVTGEDGAALPFGIKGYASDKWRKSEDGVIYKKCHDCGRWFPIDHYPLTDKLLPKSKDGHSCFCKECQDKKSTLRKARLSKIGISEKEAVSPKGVLTAFTDVELIQELRLRGYAGSLSFTKTIAV